MRLRQIPDHLRTTDPRKSEEETLQRAIVEHLRWRADKSVLWWHTPNGEKRSKATAGRLKAMGVVPGVPDLVFVMPDCSVAFMELKARDGVMSQAQIDFQARCEAIGANYVLCYSIDTAISVLEAWGVLPPETNLK